MRYSLLLLVVFSLPVYPQSKDHIGVKRSVLVALFEDPDLDFVFQKESRLLDGTPRVMGVTRICLNGNLSADWIGSATGYVEEASITYGYTALTSDVCRLRCALAFNLLLNTVFPQWKGQGNWLESALLSDETTTTYRNGLRILLNVFKTTDGRVVTLLIDPR